MNQTSLNKIAKYRSIIWHISKDVGIYTPIIPLLDEPYKTALLVIDYWEVEDFKEVAALTGLSWQTVKQVRRVLS